ncbi:MAG: DNA polymerase IV [Candidatus Falkowbacteria bacterium]
MTAKIIAHLDMNSYFASVEQQANPFLRGKPVAVCAYLSRHGTIIASSIEAKTKGIKTGCRVNEAQQIDPNVILVENEPAKYRAVTERVFAIVQEYTDTVEPYSIDEIFLDLTGWCADVEAAKIVMAEIKQRILSEVGEWLRCSVGISWTKFLAKFAGDIAPKGAILCITPENLERQLDRPLTEAWGIGQRIETRLKLLGIYTLLELKNSEPSFLRRHFGIYGYYLWCHVNGQEVGGVATAAPPKSVGHSYCLAEKTTDKLKIKKIVYKLCEKTGRRLRALGFEAGTMHVSLLLTNYIDLAKTARSHDAFFTTTEIFQPIEQFIDSAEIVAPVRQSAVTATNLKPLSNQLSFFSNRPKQLAISQVMDTINDRYGEYKIKHGLMFGTDEQAKDRIGFRKSITL